MARKVSLASIESRNDFNSNAGTAYHIIVQVEFNGKKPSGTYYDRLHSMGIWVNGGNREEFPSPLDRRHNIGSDPQALVLQEGMFSCTNEDVAKRIANLADEHGADVVTIGRYYSTVYRVNDADLQAYDKYKKGVGKRGPKNQSETGTYTITCFHEVKTFEATLDSSPMSCSCGSMHFTVHFGVGKRYVKPNAEQDGNPYDYWCRSRFANGVFEIPLKSTPKTKHTPPLSGKNVKSLPALEGGDELNNAIASDFNFALRVFDTMYCLTRFSEVERLSGRLDVINVYIHEGGEKVLYMGFSENAFDVLDLSILDKTFMRYI